MKPGPRIDYKALREVNAEKDWIPARAGMTSGGDLRKLPHAASMSYTERL